MQRQVLNIPIFIAIWYYKGGMGQMFRGFGSNNPAWKRHIPTFRFCPNPGGIKQHLALTGSVRNSARANADSRQMTCAAWERGL
jgi:hypothetical protein